MGMDISMQSATKYLNGHSDVTAGVLSGRRRLLDADHEGAAADGIGAGPAAAYALGRGMKTMTLRVAQQNVNAMAVAQSRSRATRRSTRVYYPGLASHPDHAIAGAQMSGFGGMVTIDVKGGQAAAFRDVRPLQADPARGQPWRASRASAACRSCTSHTGLSDEELAAAGVTRGMIRISIGLEDAQDLIEDVTQALA